MKNQIGIILGFSELLLQELDPADVHRADLQEIHAAGERAMRAVDELHELLQQGGRGR